MAQLSDRQQKYLGVIYQAAAAPVPGTDDERGALLSSEGIPNRSPYCASLIREEGLQYRFMVLYQGLVAVLAFMVLGLLALAAWGIAEGSPIASIGGGVATLTTGAGAVFFFNQRSDAREFYEAAQEGLKQCPS